MAFIGNQPAPSNCSKSRTKTKASFFQHLRVFICKKVAFWFCHTDTECIGNEIFLPGDEELSNETTTESFLEDSLVPGRDCKVNSIGQGTN